MVSHLVRVLFGCFTCFTYTKHPIPNKSLSHRHSHKAVRIPLSQLFSRIYFSIYSISSISPCTSSKRPRSFFVCFIRVGYMRVCVCVCVRRTNAECSLRVLTNSPIHDSLFFSLLRTDSFCGNFYHRIKILDEQ